eukprot:s69_g20.t2
MGSGGSCAKSTGPGSCDIPKDWPAPQKTTGPDLFTHQLYELDTYLRKVAKKPEVFQKKARSGLTGELCEPVQTSGNLRGRRLHATHIVHHVYGAGQRVMQHAYGAGSSVAHHVYGAGSSMMNHVYGAGHHVVHHVYGTGYGQTYQTSQLHGNSLVQGAPAHVVSKVYGPEDSKEIHIVSGHHGYHIVDGGRINDFGRNPEHFTTHHTHTIVHHHYGGYPDETYYVHPGSHHFMEHFAGGTHVDCTDSGNWYYEWDAHKKHLCCSAVHVGCPGTWRGPEDHWMDSDTIHGGFLNGKRPADVDSGFVDDGFVNGVGPADVSDVVGDDFVNGKGPADVSQFVDDGTVDSGTVEGGMVDSGTAEGAGALLQAGVVDDAGALVVQRARWNRAAWMPSRVKWLSQSMPSWPSPSRRRRSEAEARTTASRQSPLRQLSSRSAS